MSDLRRAISTCGAVCIFLAGAAPATGGAAGPGAAAGKPNILVILTDDQGRGDYSAFGTSYLRTPHMDRLGREGMTFENFFANSCVCSPSRAALLTGCYPDRVGVPGVIREETPDNSWGYLAPRARLLPQLLQPAGYHTALIGKWHLGTSAPNTPTERGFDFFHGFLGDMMDDYWTHRRHGRNFMRRNLEVVDPPGHATDVFTTWACDYLTERAKAGGAVLPLPRLQRAAHADPAAAGMAREGEAARAGPVGHPGQVRRPRGAPR